VLSAYVAFDVPEIPTNEAFVRGPLLARVVPEGVLIRGDQGEQEGDTELDKILGNEETVEPLLVNDVESSDTLLAAWDLCVPSKSAPGSGAVIERRVVTEEGQMVHRLDDIAVALEPRGKLSCQAKLDSIPAGTLNAGEYRVEVVLADNGGSELAQGSVPLMVR
jgi:hypothetical protein